MEDWIYLTYKLHNGLENMIVPVQTNIKYDYKDWKELKIRDYKIIRFSRRHYQTQFILLSSLGTGLSLNFYLLIFY